jgi:hypothetical protein
MERKYFLEPRHGTGKSGKSDIKKRCKKCRRGLWIDAVLFRKRSGSQPDSWFFYYICASCKKVRGDKGYWQQLQEYVRDHSEADFSHSLCPDCLKKLYSELKK